MRTLVLHNPIAGSGRAAVAARRVAAALRDAGHGVSELESRKEPPDGWLTPALAGVDTLVVVGGDGAVRMAASVLSGQRAALYHYPAGTENLFARAFGIEAMPEQLVSALTRDEVVKVDLGDAEGESFVLMASAGFDAEVIHDLSEHRVGGISHLSYVGPILRQLRRWRAPILTVHVDGTPLVEAAMGTLVVANCAEYAMRFNPARNASMTDGQFDVVFMPAATRHELAAWMIRCRLGRQLEHPSVRAMRGERVEITSESAFAVQLDGDPVTPRQRLSLAVRPEALSVLTP